MAFDADRLRALAEKATPALTFRRNGFVELDGARIGRIERMSAGLGWSVRLTEPPLHESCLGRQADARKLVAAVAAISSRLATLERVRAAAEALLASDAGKWLLLHEPDVGLTAPREAFELERTIAAAKDPANAG